MYNYLETPSIGIYTREMKIYVLPLVLVLGVVLLLWGDDFVQDAFQQGRQIQPSQGEPRLSEHSHVPDNVQDRFCMSL